MTSEAITTYGTLYPSNMGPCGFNSIPPLLHYYPLHSLPTKNTHFQKPLSHWRTQHILALHRQPIQCNRHHIIYHSHCGGAARWLNIFCHRFPHRLQLIAAVGTLWSSYFWLIHPTKRDCPKQIIPRSSIWNLNVHGQEFPWTQEEKLSVTLLKDAWQNSQHI